MHPLLSPTPQASLRTPPHYTTPHIPPLPLGTSACVTFPQTGWLSHHPHPHSLFSAAVIRMACHTSIKGQSMLLRAWALSHSGCCHLLGLQTLFCHRSDTDISIAVYEIFSLFPLLNYELFALGLHGGSHSVIPETAESGWGRILEMQTSAHTSGGLGMGRVTCAVTTPFEDSNAHSS